MVVYEFALWCAEAATERKAAAGYQHGQGEYEMSNFIDYAKRELERAFPDKSDLLQQSAIKDVLELLNTLSKQGHSNLSASYVLRLFNRLAQWKPIKPLTGEDDEWGEAYGEDNTQQNKRYSAVFRKNHDNSTAYDIGGRVFIDENGLSYTNRDSCVPVIFPYAVPDKPEFVHRRMP